MPQDLSPTEKHALLFIGALIFIGLLLPHIAQPEDYHRFADHREWLGIPHAADVLSNVIFMAAGVLGLLRMRSPHAASITRKVTIPLGVFFSGLILTGLGSAYYHWAPDSRTILFDRLPMVIAFAGIIGAFLSQRISVRVGMVGMAVSLLAGVAGLALSIVNGSLALYLVLQFGGLVGLVVGLLLTHDANDPFPWWGLVNWYVLAKFFEIGDHFFWDMTQHLVSGHTLKHLAAGMAGMVLLNALRARARRRRGPAPLLIAD